MIIGKYFESNRDFVNLMKVSKRFKDIVSMYKFNPISDCSLFENVQTQHFYKIDDIYTAKKGMYRYIFWGHFLDCHKKYIREVNDKKLKYKCNQYDDKVYIKDKMISKFDEEILINKTLINTLYDLGEKLFDSNNNYYNEILIEWNYYLVDTESYVLFVYEDFHNNYLCKICKSNIHVLTNEFIYSKFHYFNHDGTNMSFENGKKEYRLLAMPNEIVMETNSYDNITIGMKFDLNKKINKYKITAFVVNSPDQVSYKNCDNFVFSTNMNEKDKDGETDKEIKIKSLKIFKLNFRYEYNSKYYTELLGRSDLNIIYDSWKEEGPFNENLGFMRIIQINNDNNYIIYNILPTEVILTVRLFDKITVYKPVARMVNFISRLLFVQTIKRYRWKMLEGYYAVPYRDIIAPLSLSGHHMYRGTRLCRVLVATNEFTPVSCVNNNSYYIHVNKGTFANY